MYDSWEENFGCLRRVQATLRGYTRSFSKASTVNWGSKIHPAPTLRVVQRKNAVCCGIAFKFAPECRDAVIAYLARREGKSFERQAVALTLTDGGLIEADCFFYNGKNLIEIENIDEMANMVLQAHGEEGSALDYILNVKDALDRMGIGDESVATLYAAVTGKRAL